MIEKVTAKNLTDILIEQAQENEKYFQNFFVLYKKDYKSG
jgi:hypothetical protein